MKMSNNHQSKNINISLLDDIANDLPALARANCIQQQVAAHGFDWPSWHGCFEKIQEEVLEVKQELMPETIDQKKVAEELGDLLFAVVNLVRNQGIDPEKTLHQANAKFERRFRGVEAILTGQGLMTADATLEQMDIAWEEVKSDEKKSV